MRNLYRHLGISRNASEDEIQEAISRCEDEGIREDASCVLLNKRYRTAYDNAYDTLTMMAEIGATLSVPDDALWDDTLAEEFRVTDERRAELPKDILAKYRAAEEDARQKERSQAEEEAKQEKLRVNVAERRHSTEKYAYLLSVGAVIVIPILYFVATLVVP